jgi:TolA-binding protein
MIAQGRYQDAADSFRQHLAVHPGDHDARLALGALLCGPGGAHAEAERLFREVQDHHPTGRQEAAASQALIDHYVATGQRGRHMAELARFAERYRGTAAGRAARQALTAMKVPAPER